MAFRRRRSFRFRRRGAAGRRSYGYGRSRRSRRRRGCGRKRVGYRM